MFKAFASCIGDSQMLLSEDDLALLTSLAFEEYTQGEIAQQNHQNQQAISRQLKQIRKTF